MPKWLRSINPEPAPPARPAAGALAPAERLEQELLAGIARGRQHDFEALYRLYHPRLQRFIGQMARHPELVDEVLDDTMMVVWQRADAFDGRSKLSTWIFGIAYRKTLKALGRLDPPQEDDDPEAQTDPGPGPERQLGLAQTRQLLRRALEQLSPDHRAVVELGYFQELAYGEIAAIVDCPPETVKTRMFYARRRLRALLDGLAGHLDGGA